MLLPLVSFFLLAFTTSQGMKLLLVGDLELVVLSNSPYGYLGGV